MKRIACLFVLLVLTACGGGSGGSDNASKPPTGASTTAAKADGGAKNPLNGEDFCAFLTKKLPRLKTDGSTAGALADLAIELATWIGDHPEQKPRTSADLDDASQKTCPDVRKQVVATLGTTSFVDAL